MDTSTGKIYGEGEFDQADHSHVHLHVLELPPTSEHGEFYRQTTSFSWFFHGPKRRNEIPGKRLFHVSWWDDFERQTKLNRKSMAKYCIRGLDDTELPTTTHESLWAFYKAVGYDYKTKKWSEQTPQKVPKTTTKCV